jgi:zinc protease
MPLTRVTPAKLAACRANAKRSKGPRTPEGKRRSSRNAATHGLTNPDIPPALHLKWQAIAARHLAQVEDPQERRLLLDYYLLQPAHDYLTLYELEILRLAHELHPADPGKAAIWLLSENSPYIPWSKAFLAHDARLARITAKLTRFYRKHPRTAPPAATAAPTAPPIENPPSNRNLYENKEPSTPHKHLLISRQNTPSAMLRTTTKSLLLALAFIALAPAADTPPPLKFQAHALPNGLKVVLAADNARPVINLQVWYHVGSKDEKTGRTGFAHLFEHLMFQGSRNVPPEEHSKYVRRAGGQDNAYTTFDQTVYWETFPSNYLEQMLWLEADRMASLNVSDEVFKKEREVVKEERRQRMDNTPYGRIIEDVLANTYTRYPYRHHTIGSMDDLNKAVVADVRDFHSIYYVPNNATLVIVGDFDPAEALNFVRKHFSAIPQGKPVPRVTETEPPQTALREVTVKYPAAPLDAVITAYHLPPMGHPDSYALEIASNILSEGQSSRLYKRLVYDEQSAAGAGGQGMFLEGPSLFFGYAIVNQGKNVKEVANSLEYTFNEIAQKGVTADELEKARNSTIAGFILGRESAQAKASFLGSCAVLLKDPARYNTELDRYRAVTAADVQRVVKQYLTKTNLTRVWVQPGAGAAAAKQENQ